MYILYTHICIHIQVKYDTDEADYEWIADQFKAVRQDMVIQVNMCVYVCM